MHVLAHLLSHPGNVISKNALLDTVWTDVFVTENNLEQGVGAVRKAVDDDAAAPRLIQTVKRKGTDLSAPSMPALHPRSATRSTTG